MDSKTTSGSIGDWDAYRKERMSCCPHCGRPVPPAQDFCLPPSPPHSDSVVLRSTAQRTGPPPNYGKRDVAGLTLFSLVTIVLIALTWAVVQMIVYFVGDVG